MSAGGGIATYADLARTTGGMVLCNAMERESLEHVGGELAPWDEVFQWYVVADPSFLLAHTDEAVFYHPRLGLYVWAVTFLGISWEFAPAPGIR